jgi:predicted metal-dependent hydrolase
MAETQRDDLAEAVELFNGGRYFEAHDVLERLWLVAECDDRVLYQGVLQVAVGMHHAVLGNRKGSDSLLRRGLANLDGLPSMALGLDVAGLRQQTQNAIAVIERSENPLTAESMSIAISYRP